MSDESSSHNPTGATQLWLIEPIANPVDSLWQDRTIWKRVVVRAESDSFARLAAEEWALQNVHTHIGNESPSPVAGFTDVRLYRVSPLPQEAHGLLEGQEPSGPVIVAEAFGKSPWPRPDL